MAAATGSAAQDPEVARGSLPENAVVLEVPWEAGVRGSPDASASTAAATAMVLRYWGFRGIEPGDVKSPLHPSSLTAADAARFVRSLGWEAHLLTGPAAAPEEIERHLRLGRPVVLATASPVLVVGFAIDGGPRLVVHDPTAGPYRIVVGGDVGAPAGRETAVLLVLPPRGRPNVRLSADADPEEVAENPAGAVPGYASVPARCHDPFERGLAAARDGRLTEAAGQFRSDGCDESPAVALELAGALLRAGRTREAIPPAVRATRGLPGSRHAWRTLATARYVRGDRTEALRAWNRVGEPTLDLVRVDAAGRTGRERLASRLGLVPGRPLSPRELAMARRRLAATPSVGLSRVGYDAAGPGRVDVQAAVVERPLAPTGPVALAALGLRAAIYRQVALVVASPLRLGETWRFEWRWWENRPAANFRLDVPGVPLSGGVGALAVGGEKESYGTFADGLPGAPTSGPTATPASERLGGFVETTGWWTPSLETGLRVGVDRWEGSGARVRAGGRARALLDEDRLRADVEFDGWSAAGDGAGFHRANVGLRYGRGFGEWLAASLRGTIRTASRAAPLTLWPGAGTGIARPDLLRAHPLLDDGRITGVAFDRHLAGGGAEATRWLWRAGPVRVGAAVFLDGAHTWGEREAATRFDAGLGLRLGSVAGTVLRIDAAWGLSDEARAVSAGGVIGIP